MKDLLIYTNFHSPKLKYVFDFIFKEQLGLSYEIIDRVDAFSSASHAYKLCYSTSPTSGDHSLLIEQSLYFEFFDRSIIPAFDKELFTDNTTLSSHFDFFAAIFYLLARVEEYDQTDKDTHDRYQSHNSILSTKGLLEFPIVDYWLNALGEKLVTKFKIDLVKKPPSKVISTIDIDHFFAYKHKGIGRQLGALGKDLFTLRWGRVKDRLSSSDPYDRINDMLDWHKEVDLDLLIFILTAENRTPYDKSLMPSHPLFKSTVQHLSSYDLSSYDNQCLEIGVHPSYYSYTRPTQILREKALLEKQLTLPITKSRQHFLRLKLPDTYAALIKAGIKEDYSLGYADRIGFRAGTSLPFYWYDLDKDQATELKLIPFSVMDVTLKKYLGLCPNEALQETTRIINSLKPLNGHFSMIWHNSSFYGREGWSGYEATYKEILSIAASTMTKNPDL